MLNLAVPYTPKIADTVLCYTASAELNEVWQQLTRRHSNTGYENLPYRDLSHALRFVLGDFAAIRRGPQGGQTLILTRRALPDGIAPRLFGEFERDLARRYDLPFQNRLAPLLADIVPEEVSLGRYLHMTGPTGEADIPSWVYDVATWHVIELLTARPLTLPSGRHITLRADIAGNLLAWEDLLPAEENRRRREAGMHYLSLSPITLPGLPGLFLSIDAHISRLTNFFPNARRLWLATDSDRLVLTSGYRFDKQTRHRSLKGITATLVDSFSLRGIPDLADDVLVNDPDRVRARYCSTPTSHAVGAGPGRKFLDIVRDHVLACLPADSAPLELVDSKIRVVDRTNAAKKNAITPNDRVSLADTLRTTQRGLDLVVLFATDETRARAAGALAKALDIETNQLPVTQTPAELIPGHLRISFIHASKADLLTPGDPEPRRSVAESIAQDRKPGWTSAVLAETDSEAALADNTSAKQDPKPQGRRALASHSIVSQYLDTASAPKPEKTDYPAGSALLDLMRTAGLTGTVPGRIFDNPLTPQPAVLVGIHSRQQNNPAQRMISLTATVTDGTNSPWTILGYHPDAGGWKPYPATVTAHHATTLTPFGNGLSYATRASKAASYAHRALEQLLVRYPDLPVVLFVDGVGCRTLWPGLANRTLGLSEPGSLPHLDLANAGEQQISLVRVNTNDDGELFQPVRVDTLTDFDEDASTGIVPASTKLYQLPNATTATYYLINRSRTDQVKDYDVRAGHRKTRFDIADHPKTLAAAWHSMTCTEFTILETGAWTTTQLAALSARLCGHPLVWDGRTSRPIPQHLAHQVLEDHPDRT